MAYKRSFIDRKNFKLFENNLTSGYLKKIQLTGKLRGLKDFQIEFQYPISVFAGRNGSGKTTLLSIAACAYHNKKNGFKLAARKTPYYTFSDFFIQSTEDISPSGITIKYGILYNNWKPAASLPDGKGLGHQQRIKKAGGRWNAYDKRFKRTVIYLGIDRVVPHAEKSVAKTYRKRFGKSTTPSWIIEVKDIVGRILERNYTDLNFLSTSKLRMPVVQYGTDKYSGFNMGAGENTLFEIFATICSCPEGSLILIDEIELGLYEAAQKELIEVLKEICHERKIQILCTTHSKNILSALPPEARYYIENSSQGTKVIPGISAEYASGKLSGRSSNELNIYVEDGVAESIIRAFLTKDIRQRINIIPIGSSESVMRQLAAKFLEKDARQNITFIDGDKRSDMNGLKRTFANTLSTDKQRQESEEWIKGRILFLPGDLSPEKWILQTCLDYDNDDLALTFKVSVDELDEELRKSLKKPAHTELFHLAQNLGLSQDFVFATTVSFSTSMEHSLGKEISDSIEKILGLVY